MLSSWICCSLHSESECPVSLLFVIGGESINLVLLLLAIVVGGKIVRDCGRFFSIEPSRGGWVFMKHKSGGQANGEAEALAPESCIISP